MNREMNSDLNQALEDEKILTQESQRMEEWKLHEQKGEGIWAQGAFVDEQAKE